MHHLHKEQQIYKDEVLGWISSATCCCPLMAGIWTCWVIFCIWPHVHRETCNKSFSWEYLHMDKHDPVQKVEMSLTYKINMTQPDRHYKRQGIRSKEKRLFIISPYKAPPSYHLRMAVIYNSTFYRHILASETFITYTQCIYVLVIDL